jgi:hypothetical protein
MVDETIVKYGFLFAIVFLILVSGCVGQAPPIVVPTPTPVISPTPTPSGTPLNCDRSPAIYCDGDYRVVMTVGWDCFIDTTTRTLCLKGCGGQGVCNS